MVKICLLIARDLKGFTMCRTARICENLENF